MCHMLLIPGAGNSTMNKTGSGLAPMELAFYSEEIKKQKCIQHDR